MMTRRQFMKTGVAVTAVSGPFFSGKSYAAGTADMAVITGADIEQMVRAAVAAVGGIEKFVQKGQQVAVKPNLSFASPVERAATTNPEVVQAVVKLCLEAGARRVVVMDHPLQDAAIIGEKAELVQAINSIDNASIFFPTTENMYREKPIPQGKAMTSTKVISLLDEMDTLIDIPIAKNHSATAVSLGIKGNLGLVWDRQAYHNCSDFNQSLADLATILKPNLVIVDAIRVLATRGPQGPGRVLDKHTIIAGTDPVAVDSKTVEIGWSEYGYSGTNAEHLVKSAAMGLGEIDPSKLNVLTSVI